MNSQHRVSMHKLLTYLERMVPKIKKSDFLPSSFN